jgi:hypothetical protein
MTLKPCSIAAAVALALGMTVAQAQTTPAAPAPGGTISKHLDRPAGDRKAEKAEKDRISADYKAAKAKCDAMKERHEKEVCEADAKGKEKIAKAELEQKYEPSVRHERNVLEAKAEHEYHVAKEKCDVMKGKEESACEKDVKAKYDKAKADIRQQFANRKDERPARSATSGATTPGTSK